MKYIVLVLFCSMAIPAFAQETENVTISWDYFNKLREQAVRGDTEALNNKIKDLEAYIQQLQSFTPQKAQSLQMENDAMKATVDFWQVNRDKAYRCMRDNTDWNKCKPVVKKIQEEEKHFCPI